MKSWKTTVFGVGFLAALLSGCGGIVTNREAREKLAELNTNLAKVAKDGEAALKDVAEGKAKLADLEKQLEQKLIDEKAYLELKMKVLAESSQFSDRAEVNIARAFTIHDQITDLRQEYEVPWWQIAAGGVAAVGLQILTGTNLLATRRNLGVAVEGVGLLINSIEKGSSREAIKVPIKKAQNPIVENTLNRMRSEGRI